MRQIAALPVLIGLVAVLAFAGTVRAAQPTCNGTKIDPVVSGTYASTFGSSAGSIAITVRQTDAGPVVDFVTDSSSHIVTSLAVKGGPVDPVQYTPNASSGTDYHSALNPSTGKWYGLSYLCFQTANSEPAPE